MNPRSATPLRDLVSLKGQKRLSDGVAPPWGFDMAPHSDGVRVVREDGILFYIYHMVESCRDGEPHEDRLCFCRTCNVVHDVRTLECNLE